MVKRTRAAAKVSWPEPNALSPKPACSISGSRNGMAPIPTRNRKPPVTEARKVGMRIRPRSSTG